MGSKISKSEHPAPAGTKKIVVPRIPQDIIDETLDHLIADPDFSFRSLQSCALVSKSWVPSCRRHLFHTILFNKENMIGWLEAFPVPEEGPAHHVRHLRILAEERVPKKFFEHIPWFTNAEKVTLLGAPNWLHIYEYWRFPQSVTSLTINGDADPIKIGNIMGRLPNLNDLSLSGVSGSFLSGNQDKLWYQIGADLKGGFGGRLQLTNGYATDDIMDVLLGIPTGIHFTEMQIGGRHEFLSQTASLAEACATTLVKLSCTALYYRVGGQGGFGRPFDLSKFPNLEEVDFGASYRVTEDLHWIPASLSTLRPATSPRLSAVQLTFTHSPQINRFVEAAIETMGNDLRRTANEVTRIQRKFGGGVNLTVVRDTGFKAVFDKLNIL